VTRVKIKTDVICTHGVKAIIHQYIIVKFCEWWVGRNRHLQRRTEIDLQVNSLGRDAVHEKIQHQSQFIGW